MIPKEQKGLAMSAPGDLSEPVPLLDLGKKLSVPQDLMIEELSLRNNRGSLLFQKRQRRVQRFTFELPDSQRLSLAGSAKRKALGTAEPGTVANCLEGQSYRSELHVFPGSPGGLDDTHGTAALVENARGTAALAESARNPSALAPGYSEPLKGVPPEKFNHTAIPKGYRCPWQEFISYRDYLGDSSSHTLSPASYRNFNKTPVPFGGPLVGEAIPRAGTPFVPEPFNGLELLRLRPSFNRVAQGWVRNLPESEEL
ncbi:myozenin-3 [Oryctolagus cuniculus]|uniref:myozenin-3 n=1 Tax=Oryctolagus cuniculus TaxID=9986 RepID=UPI003879AC74